MEVRRGSEEGQKEVMIKIRKWSNRGHGKVRRKSEGDKMEVKQFFGGGGCQEERG